MPRKHLSYQKDFQRIHVFTTKQVSREEIFLTKDNLHNHQSRGFDSSFSPILHCHLAQPAE
ncbi:Hypothetical protein GbCGDNIH9_7259 [Granulibacter bethesdensis]|uniref:Uncharacterized protein n=1 Tax=Granulibacter bethesdensis TaxID=364410 RepID=A0AAC9KB12_9PROT|nr:Hypothetical protein GbCGDNIH9_7259 [Granulibacter bethesdensis]APH62575.1 Hypothetical protein GbCGDNIH8_7259 [Granulibacter bethesdensis]